MMTRRMNPAAATGVALLAAACGGDADGAWQGSVQDSAGIEIVLNAGPGTWGPAEAWTVEEELVIGTADGAPEYQFGQISGIDVGSNGRLYVVDQQVREVRVFSPDGRYIATIGKGGSGPGELSQAAGPVLVGRGDTVQVPDLGNQRVNRYTAAGEPVGSFPIPMTEGIPTRWMETADQQLVHQNMVMQLPGQEDVEPRNLLLLRSSAGEVLDTLLEMPVGKSVSFAGGQPSFRLFESEPMWTLGPDGRLYHGVNSEYSLNVLSPDGELERIIRKDVERRPITENDAAEYRRIIEKLWRDQGVPPQSMEMLKQALSFADHYPAYANFLPGPGGTLWVQDLQTPDDIAGEGGTFDMQDMGSARWEVFDERGRLLGTVQMPPRFTPLSIHGDAIYGVLRDDLDVQYPARLHIDRGGSVSDA